MFTFLQETSLHMAARDTKLDEVKRTIDKGDNVNLRDDTGVSVRGLL